MNIGKILGFSSKPKSNIVNKYISSNDLTTVKSFTNHLGHKYELRGGKTNDSMKRQIYELYRKRSWEGESSWERIAAKSETPIREREKLIEREHFNPKNGRITESSTVTKDLMIVKGDALDMSSFMNINPPTMPEQIKLNVFGKDLTPMAKRVLNFIVKNR